MPKALEDEPVPPHYAWEYLYGFTLLSDRRLSSQEGYRPISMTEIASYLSIHPTDDPDLFMYLIMEMDHEFLGDKKDAG